MIPDRQVTRRWQAAFGTLLALAALVFVGCGEKPQKTYHVGILSGLEYFADTVDGFKERMNELGYTEGKNIVYDLHKTDFDMAVYEPVLKGFVGDKVDLIFVFPTEASLAAKALTKGTNIPVVFAQANIEGVDLVNSLREPGGNITGVRFPGPDLAMRRFEIMAQLAPDARRYWIPYQRGYPIVESQLAVLRPAAAARGITLIECPADGAADVRDILSKIASSSDPGMDAILFIAEPLAVTPDSFEVVAKFAAEHKLPVGGALMTVNGYGSIYGVATNNVVAGKHAANMADKILKGTPPGIIPVVSDESFLEINAKTAREIGVVVPESLLYQADKIIN